MGLLSDDFINTPTRTKATPPPQTGVVPPATTTPAQPKPSIRIDNPHQISMGGDTGEPLKIAGDLTPEEQTAKFGGEVGSTEYYKTKGEQGALSYVPREIGSAFGLKFPEDQEWDKMSTTDKLATTGKELTFATGRMVRDLPKAIVSGVGRAGITALKPFYNIATGKPFDTESLAKEPVAKVPWLGDLPTMYQTQKLAEDSGMGPIASRVMSGAGLVLDATTLLPVAEAFSNTFRPKFRPTPGEMETMAQPVKYSITPEGYKAATPSMNEYYALTKTDAKNFGGSTNDIRWKMGEGVPGAGQSLSVVKVLPESTPIGSFVKTDFGFKQVQKGDHGPEIKIFDTKLKGSPDEALMAAPTIENPRVFIEPAPKKGFENKPVDDKQISTLKQIVTVKGMDPELTSAVVRSVSGKNSVSELTQAEYTRVARSLADFGDVYKGPEPTFGPKGYIKSVISPQRHYADYVEDTFGIPFKSQVYTPIEEGARLAKTLEISLKQEFGDIFGKYTAPGKVEERRLIDAYMRGKQDVIVKNTAIDEATKAELIEIAGKLREFFNKTGPTLNVEQKAFIGDYLPNIQDIGGVFQKYKDLDTTPGKEFFAKFKREGNLGAMIDDPLASGQIYIREGARALHMGKALENAKSLIKAIPEDKGYIKRGMNSYVQEKMGYQGQVEKFIDSFVPTLNKKLPFEIPPDASRQAINYWMSGMYSGLLSTPASWFKQSFQLPMFVYGRNGGKNLGNAMAKSFTKEGRDEVAKKGFLVDLAVPYGEELTKQMTPTGRIGNAYKEGTQKLLSPMTAVDNNIRTITYHQAKMNWTEAWDKFRAGRINQTQFESELDFAALSKADQSTIRERLARGDADSAFDNYVREVIDETSFPYRQATGARIGYGLPGKMATGLLNYTIESGNVLSKWVRGGQWDKVIRLAAGAKLTNDALQETFGFDFGKSFSAAQQFLGLESPMVQMVLNGVDLLSSIKNNNKEEINKNQADIVKTITNTTIPGGIQTKNVAKFLKSYKNGQDGVYGIYDSYGKLIYEGDFNELFWTTFMNFPTEEKVNEAKTYTDLKNTMTDYNEIRGQIDQLLREGDYDEMDKLIEKTGVTPSQGAMESYYSPRLQRLFNQAPSQIKADFVPRVFSQ